MQSSQLAGSGGMIAALGILACLLICGCSSVYHRTRNQLPPDPAGESKLRLAEAAAAENRVKRAGHTLRKSLTDPRSQGKVQTDFDRLEARVHDFERQILAVRDSAAASGAVSDAESIARLAARVELWLAYVGRNRLEAAAELQELDALLK